MNNYPLFFLITIFLVAAFAIWQAGVALTKTTDSLDTRFRLGDALGGLILLGIAGSLPEIAITVSAALSGHYSVIIGNLLGGIALQTLVIVIFDLAVKGKRPLSYLAGSKLMFCEAILGAIIAVIAIFGTRISPGVAILHMSPFSIGIVIAWIVGLFWINRERKIQRFNVVASDAIPGRKHHERRAVENHPFYASRSNSFVIGIFVLASIITLISGVLVEHTGTAIASRLGIGSGLFAATFLALVSSLPEISTGLESIFIGDNQLALSDIYGGNAFMPVIFLIGDLTAKKPILPFAANQDLLFAVLGVIMILVYALAYLKPPQKRLLRMGADSLLELALYLMVILGLIFGS